MAFNPGFVYYAHNLQYDLRFFLKKMIAHKKQIRIAMRTDADIYIVEFPTDAIYQDETLEEYSAQDVVRLQDSLAVWPGTLKSFLATFTDLPKLDLDFESVAFDPGSPDHMSYAMRDTHGLLQALVNFDARMMQVFDVRLKGTTASTAMQAWRHTLSKDVSYYNPHHHEERIRKAYFGGVVFLTSSNAHEDCRSYDINSSYPYQMRSHEMPYGAPREVAYYVADVLGIYHVRIKTPDNLIVPVIPFRDERDALLWPKGEFDTHVTSVELDFALSVGYTIITIYSGLIWQKTCKPFDDFINRCERVRTAARAAGDLALETTAKLMQNGLYGKFGTKRERRKLVGEITPDQIEISSVHGDFYFIEDNAENMMCLPQWAVFTTAHARLHLLKAVYAIGPLNCLYGDTDSITVTKHADTSCLSVGAAYGQWKEDKVWTVFRARCPKVYAGKMMINGVETVKGAAKGIPKKVWKTQRVLERILEADPNDFEAVRFQRLESMVSAIKSGYIGQHDATRKISNGASSKSWHYLASGDVRPRDIGATQAHGAAGAGNPGSAGRDQDRQFFDAAATHRAQRLRVPRAG
jgi:hypothetical protein